MITAAYGGRLGNRLFQYAAVRSVAERLGYNFYGDHTLREYPIFDLEYGCVDGEVAHEFIDTNQQNYNPDIFLVNDFTRLVGFFQSEKYFSPNVREWFTPKLPSPKTDDNVGYIHFRGGDYGVWPWTIYQLPTSYYDDAKLRLKNINPNVQRFVVITDDKEAATIRFPEDEVVSGDINSDFMLLYSAKNVIISNSTFSWWAAWLNLNNIVIAPQGWLLYNSERENFSPADIKVDRFIYL